MSSKRTWQQVNDADGNELENLGAPGSPTSGARLMDVGNQGPQGFQGLQGFQGDIGTDGPQGPQGNLGFQGPQGIDGSQGFQAVWPLYHLAIAVGDLAMPPGTLAYFYEDCETLPEFVSMT